MMVCGRELVLGGGGMTEYIKREDAIDAVLDVDTIIIM